MTDPLHNEFLKSELIGLFNYIQRVKEEIAAISHPADEEHNFDNMAEQLTAIVRATETATNTIMERVEDNNDAIEKLRALVKDNKKAGKLIDKIADNSQQIFEACSFQDITGQRVGKITKSLAYVEQRVNSIVEIWGEEALDSVVVKAMEKTEDEKLLNGPQLEGKGLSQSEIDALFD